ncbi:hypothetical protein CEP52_004753 [Fusarium oligoseptatum]|uniref:Uncharacterized protein n=1 Tax=Fusarium oligoseptatum TaxID=2604345 RepID=A0A428U267_9HYPO|nr:hypothetical protein CEP52_004753 [Fusarium oligoseptatum]
MTTVATDNQATDLSKQYDTPLGLAHSTMQALKDRIKLHYDLASDYYLSLWFGRAHPSWVLANFGIPGNADERTGADKSHPITPRHL